jgi:voltage-gated potassium channel
MNPRRDSAIKADQRLRNRAQRVVANRRVFPFLAAITAVLAVGVGILVRFVDHRDFHTIGDGIWWAVVTLATVGYGDIVPHTTWGRVIGVVVIVLGVTFLSFLTATVTSLFVASDQDESHAEDEQRRVASEEETRALLREILERLDRLEKKRDDPLGEGSQR